MKGLLVLFVYLPLFTFSQKIGGVSFQEYQSWQHVMEEARVQNKYIFVDCFTTWCQPCKWMDQNVFSNEKVGLSINDKFISVKLQMDSTSNDREGVKQWYSVSKLFQTEYKITSFPCYLFFDSTGKLIYRSESAVSVEEFISITKKALDSNYQYYALMDQYLKGNRNYKIMPYLIKGAKLISNEKIAKMIALDYKRNYLDKADDSTLLRKEIIDFITGDYFSVFFEKGSNGKYFKLFLKDSSIIDSIQNRPGFSLWIIKQIIKKEEITVKLYKDGKIVLSHPNWDDIRRSIIKKYGGAHLKELLYPAQMEYYSKKHNWKNYIKVLEKQMQMQPPKVGPPNIFVDTDPFQVSDAWALNGVAWKLFLHCNEKEILKKALELIEIAIELEKHDPNLQYLDTKANLLYKLGYVNDAIALETKALELDQHKAREKGMTEGLYFGEFSTVINKMKEGVPTWRTN